MAKALKRRRKNRATDNTDDSTRVTITCLPFELIAEILLYSNSLTDVLSLSRTCKHFNATLVQNPVAAFIWKRVRAQATLPIPDPTVFGFSEPELANFIYGGGKCTVCGKRTENMYASFSARIRFCGDPKCRLKDRVPREVEYNGIPSHASWLPWIEWTDTNAVPGKHPFAIIKNVVNVDETRACLVYVRGQLLEARSEYNKAALLPETLEEYKKRKQKYVDGLENWMNGCLELCRWKWDYIKLQRVITQDSRAQIEAFATEQGREEATVMDTPAATHLLREKLFDFKMVVRSDVEAVWPEIEADLSRIESRRENAKIEHARLWRRGEVERLHRELDRSRFYCFPSLHQFRKLPTLRIFQDGTLGPENVSWRNDFVDGLVTNDIQEWAAKMVKEFSERLGYPGWVPTNTLTNPVHWISSRFMCTRCSKSGPKVTRNKSLSFAEAAHHTCVVSEMGNKDQWSPENFVVDAKATAVITRFMTGIGLDVQEKTVADSAAISRDVMCLSCSAPIVMCFDVMIQHSHRHDDMEFMVLEKGGSAKFSDYPVTPGVVTRFMKTNQQTREQRKKPYFGCKHCIQNPLAEPSSDREAPPPRKKKSKAFNFDGLRCHLREKHKVGEVADEDLFVFEQYFEEFGST